MKKRCGNCLYHCFFLFLWHVFDGVDEALRVPGTDLRLFGKPESFAKRRMGVALAFDADVEVARTRAKLAASKVKPRVA